jgi:DNA-directed RNA polymerase specialized sigma24 family protein
MTVQASEPTTTLDRAAAEQRLNEIYRQHWRRVHGFIYLRLDDRHQSMAEDLAADVFITLWTKYLGAGQNVNGHPLPLLYTIARYRIGTFYKVKANRYLERAVDFTDPANRGIEAGHSYAPHQPEAAMLARELDDAMDRMTELSKLWRDKHSETHQYKAMLDGTGRQIVNPRVRKGLEDKFTEAAAENSRLLKQFRQACGRVGKLRADLEAAGGPNWCSSTGQPPSQNRSFTPPGTMSDPNRTHCDTGHELTLMNTVFRENGQKICRTCLSAQLREAHEKKRGGPVKPRPTSVSPKKLAKARELLKDPKNSIRKVADIVGIPRTTLTESIDIAALRDPAAARIPTTPDDVIDRALKLLLDPDNRQSVAKVAQQVGVSATTLYARIPNLTARRHQVYGDTVLIGANAR